MRRVENILETPGSITASAVKNNPKERNISLAEIEPDSPKTSKSDRPCEFSKNDFDRVGELIEANSKFSVDFMYLQLIGDLYTGPFAGKVSNSSNEVLKFYDSLLLAGLLWGKQEKPIDLNKSFYLMNQLASEYPRNGAYHYFLGSMAHKLGHSKDLVIEHLTKAVQSKKFNTHSKRIANTFKEQGFSTPENYMRAMRVVSRMPVPNIADGFKLIKKFLTNKDMPKNLIKSFAYRLMEPALRVGGAYEFYLWSYFEYAYGQQLYRLIEPNNNYPSHREIMSYRLGFVGDIETKLSRKFETAKDNKCPIGAVEEVMNEEYWIYMSANEGRHAWIQ